MSYSIKSSNVALGNATVVAHYLQTSNTALTIKRSDAAPVVVGVAGNITAQTATIDTLIASALQGNGALLTSLDANNISSGVLSVARGGTGVTASTGGGGLLVLSQSPTLSGNAVVNGSLSANSLIAESTSLTTSLTAPVVYANLQGQSATLQSLVPSSSNLTIAGNLVVSNTVTATSFVGDGSSLTGIVVNNASLLTEGVLSDSLLPSDIGITGNLSAGTFHANSNSTATNPAFTFDTRTNTGMFSPAANAVALSAGGSEKLRANDAGVFVTGNIDASFYTGNGYFLTGVTSSNASSLTEGVLSNDRLPSSISITGNVAANSYFGNGYGLSNINAANLDGSFANVELILLGGGTYEANASSTASNPSFTFDTRTNTGMFSPAANAVALSAGGSEKLRANDAGVFVTGNIDASFYTGNGYFLTGVTSSNASSLTEGVLSNSRLPSSISITGNLSAGNATVTGNVSTKAFYANIGSVSLPSYSFQGDVTSGMYSTGAGIINFATGGTSRLQASNIGLEAWRLNLAQLYGYVGFGLYNDGANWKNSVANVGGAILYNNGVSGLEWHNGITGGAVGTTQTISKLLVFASGGVILTGLSNSYWHTSFDGKNRFNFSANGATFFGSQGGYYWRSAADVDTMTLTNAGALSVVDNITGYASDERLKSNIRPLENALEKVCAVRGVQFTWRDDGPQPMKGPDVGLIAQEVQKILPAAVSVAPFDADEQGKSKSGQNYLTIDITGNKLNALFVEAIKELRAQVVDLEKQVQDLKKEILK